MRSKLNISILFLVMLLPSVMADNVTFSLNQSDYYFLVNEQAVLDLNIVNNHDEIKKGQLSYTTQQRQSQAGFQYSSSNTQSTPFSVGLGEGTAQLNFGTSNLPLELNIQLSFAYDNSTVDLEGINIHFVEDESQKQNQENKQESSSKEKEEPQSSQEQQEQQEQQEPKESSQSPAEQARQNSQLNQDTGALKEQIQKDMEKQKKMQDEFNKNLAQNEDFQQEHQDVMDKGFNATSANNNPITNNTGSFEVNYQNELGQNMSVKGYMENGTITEIKQELQEEDVSEDDEKNSKDLIFGLFLLMILILAVLLVYRKYYYHPKKNEPEHGEEKEIDYVMISQRIIKLARSLFKENRKKEAYCKVSEAIRFYYSHKLNLKKELTNTDLIRYLRQKKMPVNNVQKCMNICMLVEFAKYRPNKGDFSKIVDYAGKIIK